MKFKLEPRRAVGPIELGASRVSVRSVLADLGLPLEESRGTLDYFFGAAIQVEYEEERASFIGIWSHEQIELLYRDRDLLDLEAEESFRLILAGETSRGHDFDPAEHLLPDQIIALWEADSQYDRKRKESRMVWGQIGIGDERYLAAIAKYSK
jgi:hypothetical protein